MREQLVQYVSLLFAGAQNCEDIKQEILQNTLDRYDDLIAEGKTPEAAYRLAIVGIGDINDILRGVSQPVPAQAAYPSGNNGNAEGNDTPTKKLLRAVAVGLYILSPLPLFVLSEMHMGTLGLCGLLCIVAVATVLIILGWKKGPKQEVEYEAVKKKPETELHKSINSLIWAIGLAVYFILSISTGAWHITWIMFPIIGAVKGLAKAILDLKETSNYEN